jgi:transcriptional regulator with XRE-family HTH domain
MSGLRTLVGTCIRRLRTERGLTQAQLAEKIGRSLDLVSRIEMGDSAPSFETLEEFSRVLDVRAAELFGAPPTQEGSKLTGGSELLARISELTHDERAWLTNLVEVAIAHPTRGRK